VEGLRTTRRNLVKPAVRQFWVSLAQLMAPDGRIDILGGVVQLETRIKLRFASQVSP